MFHLHQKPLDFNLVGGALAHGHALLIFQHEAEPRIVWFGEGTSRLCYPTLYAHTSAHTSFDETSSHFAPRLKRIDVDFCAQVGGNLGSDVGVGFGSKCSESRNLANKTSIRGDPTGRLETATATMVYQSAAVSVAIRDCSISETVLKWQCTFDIRRKR